jgi:hypothetical protein
MVISLAVLAWRVSRKRGAASSAGRRGGLAPVEQNLPDARFPGVRCHSKGITMKRFASCALLPAAALLVVGGCASNLPANSIASVQSSQVASAQTGTVVTPGPVYTTSNVVTSAPYVATTPVMMSNGTVVNMPVTGAYPGGVITNYANGTTYPNGIVTYPNGNQVVTTTTPGTVTYAQTYASPGFAVPGSAVQTVTTTSGPARLSGGEIQQLMINNTASGVASNGQPYFLRFGSDGRVRFRQSDFNDSGSWRVSNDLLCSTMTKTNVGVEQCYGLYRDGSNVMFDRNGTRVGSFTVLAGNPQNL